MRYIRQERVLTLVCDEIIHDIKVMEKLLTRLKDDATEFSMSINKTFSGDFSQKVISYTKVRVKKIDTNKNTVDFLIFQNKATNVLKDVNFKDISEIRAITTSTDLLDIKPDTDRFSLMDIEADIK
jgi:hypothetical protein